MKTEGDRSKARRQRQRDKGLCISCKFPRGPRLSDGEISLSYCSAHLGITPQLLRERAAKLIQAANFLEEQEAAAPRRKPRPIQLAERKP